MNARILVLGTLGSLSCLAACGSMPPPAPSAAAGESKATEAAPGAYPPPPAPSGFPAQPAPDQPRPGSPPSVAARLAQGQRSFEQSRIDLEVAGSDCKSACRALGAMDRTAGELCELARLDPTCSDAGETVRSARDKVRAACGACPDGVSVDRNAPIPSARPR